MVSLGLPFLKKKESTVIPGKGVIPIDRVRELASRGFSEPEMIDVLRRDGFSPDEIDKALTQALQIGVSGEQHQSPSPHQQQSQQMQNTQIPSLPQLPPQPQQETNELGMPQIPETSLPEDYYSQYPTEDYVDYIVQARIAEYGEKMENMEKKIGALEDRINLLNEKILQFSQDKSQSNEVSGRMESFNETVNDIGSRVGSLERAFKETLPVLIESVRGLGDIVQKIKKES